MHHVIGDDWSMGVPAREVALLDEAFRAGQPACRRRRWRIQFADYAAGSGNGCRGSTWSGCWSTGGSVYRTSHPWNRH